MPACSKKSPPAREGRAASSARARGLINTQLHPRSGRTAKRPANGETKSDVCRVRSESANVNNIHYLHQRARDSREKIPHRREPDGKINIPY
ncbi:hypothetical protein EVAR_19639_1 [Eumeta japonica]|uniref:Uncharacterized protein n=1 Tax=Eumeta variegata TaxID=151549 RepID=A0A4C1UGS2_EUMVA|nr:hypothetical protein EVAR_19639_1 [Eumeta japonica]